MVASRGIHRDDVEQYPPVVYRERPREELAIDYHLAQVLLVPLMEVELLERQAILQVRLEPEDVGVYHDLLRYGLLLRGHEHVVQRLSRRLVVPPRLLDEHREYPVGDQPRDERTLLVLRVPLEEVRLDVELVGLVEGIKELAGDALELRLVGVVQRVPEGAARQEEPRHLVVPRDEGTRDHVGEVGVVGDLAHQEPLPSYLVFAPVDRPDVYQPVFGER